MLWILSDFLQCFYTMAWTTVQLNNNKLERTNLLAVAGNERERELWNNCFVVWIEHYNVYLLQNLQSNFGYLSQVKVQTSNLSIPHSLWCMPLWKVIGSMSVAWHFTLNIPQFSSVSFIPTPVYFYCNIWLHRVLQNNKC